MTDSNQHSELVARATERAQGCLDEQKARPYGAPVATYWYAEDVPGLLEQFDALARIGWGLVYDNMHFHERAMADPFEAESYVQGVGQSIIDITGMPNGVRVLDVGSNPASSHDVVCKCGGSEAGDHHFDRSICACGAMHYYCNRCGWQCEPCDDTSPAKERD